MTTISANASSQVVAALRTALPESAIIADPDALIVYECDGFTIPRATPLAVVFPESIEQVVAAVNICRTHNVAILPRGSATGLVSSIATWMDKELIKEIERTLGQQLPRCTVPGVEPYVEIVPRRRMRRSR